MKYRSYVHLLEEKLHEDPRAVLYRWLRDGEACDGELTRAGLDRRARAIASRLRRRLEPGDRALLLYPPGLELIASFFGCLYAGVIAVPAYPPRGARTLPRIRTIVDDARPAALLTDGSVLARLQKAARGEPALEAAWLLATDAIDGDEGDGWRVPDVGPETVAFLQYTSGSTAEPKGVVVSHGNLLHNEEVIRSAFGQSEDSVVVSWLPPHHDMGLIGGILQPLYSGGSSVLMAPGAFLQQPVRWLRAITEFSATTSGGPDFGYALCADKVPDDELDRLDLSTWQVAFDGSEPVRAETLDRFTAAFARCGFRRRAFYPCYGLAEATLFVSGPDVDREPSIAHLSAEELERHRAVPAPEPGPAARRITACGRPRAGHEVVVVDPETRRRLPAGRIGEIWFSGPSVAHGYWGKPEATEHDFRAHLADEGPGGPFLRTGDLGFVDGDELYVTGRLKDLIILRGRNHYPHDLEATAEGAHDAVRAGGTAAFSVDSAGEERLVLACELERRSVRDEAVAPAVVEAVREALFAEHEAAVADVVLLPPGGVPRTSSGKIRRRACARAYADGTLGGLHRDRCPEPVRSAPANEGIAEAPSAPEGEELAELDPAEKGEAVENLLRRWAARLLDVRPEEIAEERPLIALGLDSLRAAELAHQVHRHLGVAPDLDALLDGASLRDLADRVLAVQAAREGEEGEASRGASEGAPASRSYDLPADLPADRGQRALWFLDGLGQQPRAYTIAVGLRAEGPLDEAALERAFDGLVRRHHALRTTFHETAEGLRQRIARHGRLDFALVDAASVEPRAHREIERSLRQAAWAPFDLAAGPLLRVRLFRHGPRDHTLVLSMHHVVGDFWSLGILFRELRLLYAQETGGEPAHLEPLAVHPADRVRREEEILSGPRGESLWRTWRDVLEGAPPELDLPTDRPRPPVQGDRGAQTALTLDPHATAAILRLARETGTTLFTVLVTGFATALARWSGQDDLVIGAPASGRRDADLAPLVGYLVNPLPLRVRLGGAPDGLELLERVRRVVLGGFRHQDLPFPLLTERLRPHRDPARSPLFQTMITLQAPRRPEDAALAAMAAGDPGAQVSLGQAVLRPVPLGEPPAQFDLSLTAATTESGESGEPSLRLSLVHSTDLFDATTARRWLHQTAVLLGELGRRPDRPVADLPLLAPAERHQLLVEWNDTATDADSEPVDLFGRLAARAARWPDRIALCAGDRSVSYGELFRRARALVGPLRRLGAAPEVPVAIFLDRSTAMVETLLGVLAAGAPYVPLDPGYPPSRIADALVDSGAVAVVTTSELAPALAGFSGAVLELDRLGREQSGSDLSGPERSAPQRVPASDLASAYVIYTSGSTGRPKGVQVTHRGVLGFLGTMGERPGIGPDDCLVAVTTLAFDIAVLELLLPLTVGAQVVVAEDGAGADGESLGATLARRRATLMQATPGTWRLLLDAGWAGGSGFRALSGGEALPPELAAELLERAGAAWNLYGPTETTIWSTVARLEPGSPRVTVGRPIGDTVVRVLDATSRPVPQGVPGELALGGRGLARGYLGRPATTAERFVPDPLAGFAATGGRPGAWSGARSGARLYRTGDLVRQRPDGRIQYLGRLDHQVKLRGYRIELGEVETVLASHPSVARAVAVVREVGAGDQRLVAYVVATGDETPEAGTLREHLRAHLPEAFVPAEVVVLGELPTTANGKVDRRALPDPAGLRSERGAGEAAAPRSALESAIAAIWARILGVDAVGVHDNFFDLGGHSLLLPKVRSLLEEELGRAPRMVDLFRYPTVAALAGHLTGELAGHLAEPLDGPGASGVETTPDVRGREISVAPAAAADRAVAVIGLAGRFPGARDVDELWRRLRAGEECIRFFSREELAEAGVSPELLAEPRYVRAAGFLEGADLFDAEFFGFTPREAETTDPQHRLFLELAWAALEDAGYAPGGDGGRVGVFAGVGLNTYLLQSGLGAGLSVAARYQAFVGNDKDFVPTRVSYKLDLRGPSVNVQTACSSSLVAVHLACRSLLDGECEMALAGGVTVRVPQAEGYLYEEGGIPSPDGHCRPFDAQAAGTVFGSGAGIVVLKPLARALADGDAVRAVIRGSAVNNDGAGKIGYTAPSVDGQAEVVARALAVAQTPAESIDYVEAHGTGTRLGDPIEVAALAAAFTRAGGRRNGSCALGSIKGNVGHLDTAAGVAGLIKTVRALEAGELPPSLHFERPNPELDLAAGPFHVNGTVTPWPRGERPRRAGVSSFGIGGTNAHVVLEEAPAVETLSSESAPDSGPAPVGRSAQLLVLSARTAEALEAASTALARRLGGAPALGQVDQPDLADVAFTLQVGRRRFAHRRVLVCADAAEARAALDPGDPERLLDRHDDGDRRPVAFLFSGQGSQHPRMAAGLYADEPVFRRHLDACADHLEPRLGLDLRKVLFDAPQDDADAAAALERTELAQPALFAVEYALARLWMSWGVRPVAMLGHSVGEYVAACLAGVFSLESALDLVATRGRLMQEMAPGEMVSVPLAAAELERFLGPELDLAAINGPAASVVSGAAAAVARLEEDLAAAGVRSRRLHTSHAFHSALMDPAVDELVAAVRRAGPRTPRRPYVSNLTGTWATPEQVSDPESWGRHLRETVRFADGLACLLEDPETVLLEVGPGSSLTSLARRAAPERTAVASLRHPLEPADDDAFLLRSLGRLWLAGVEIDWHGVHAEAPRRRVPLPTYPFERRRFWLAAGESATGTAAAEPRAATGSERAVGGPLQVPVWRPRPPAAEPTTVSGTWLVLDDGGPVGAALGERLATLGARVVRAVPGGATPTSGDSSTDSSGDSGEDGPPVRRVDPACAEAYRELLVSLAGEERLPERIVHAWNLGPVDPGAGRTAAFDSLVLLSRALEAVAPGRPARIDVLSTGLHRIGADPPPIPERSLLLGPLQVIPLELPHVACAGLDLPPAVFDALDARARGGDRPGTAPDDLVAELVGDLVAELAAAPDPDGDRVAALRGGRRWVRRFEPLEAAVEPGPESGPARVQTRVKARGEQDGVPAGSGAGLRDGGHYLITGGLGGLGLAVAEDLARHVGARLSLVGRTPAPPRELWRREPSASEPAAGAALDDEASRLAARLAAVEALGGAVEAFAADVADPDSMAAVLAQAEERFGPVHGVVHAAGVAGGAMLHLETADAVDRVLRPKVAGTRVLADLFAGRSVDFVALFSSVNAVAGGFGQASYVAANAYLDTVAEAAFRRRGTRIVSIGWGPWAEVGMAARSVVDVAGAGSAAPESTPLDVHPLLGPPIAETAERAVFRNELRPECHWVLSEHRVAGRPTVPGTTYLEMARAAFARRAPAGSIEILDAVFPEPLVVEDGRAAEVVTVVERVEGADGAEGEAAFRVVSSAPGGGWREHARGRLAVGDGPEPEVVDLATTRAGCTARVLEADAGGGDPAGAGDLLTTGSRWRSLRRIHVGESQLLAEIELPSAFADDLSRYPLHPALLDLAAGAVRLVAGGDYLPLAYRRLIARGPLPARCFAHAVLSAPLQGSPEVLTCDVKVFDPDGRTRVEIHGFAMRRVDAAALAARAGAAPEPLGEEAGADAGGAGRTAGFGGPALATIPPEEGAALLRRVLAGPRLPHVLVSPAPIDEVIREIRRFDRAALIARYAGLAASPAPRSSAAAGDGDGPVDLAEDELERRIAAVWSRVLGVERVGLHDNFFELGGTSLTGIQLVSELGRELGTELSAVSIFEAPTVAALARSLRAGQGETETTTERAQARADRRARALAAVGPRSGRRAR